jgi:hypothetical protein
MAKDSRNAQCVTAGLPDVNSENGVEHFELRLAGVKAN